MKPFILFCLIVLTLPLFSNTTQRVLVTRVIDGDSIHVTNQNKQKIIVRLWGIDAPELNQRDGAQSGRFLSTRLNGQTVQLITKGTDQYNRTLGIIYDQNNININQEMIELGLAWVYRPYFNNEYPNWIQLEAEAKQNKWGLWRRKSPTPPWEFRKKNR